MKEYPVTFAIQETPHDPFDAESILIYRGVVKCKGLFDGALPITEPSDDPEYVINLIQEYITNENRNKIIDTRFRSTNERFETAIQAVRDHFGDRLAAHQFDYRHKAR